MVASKCIYARFLRPFLHKVSLNLTITISGMQFSFVPWIYDQEVIDHTKDMIAIRKQYEQEMVDLFRMATITGEPVNRPIWWIDPYDEIAFSIEDGKIT